MVVGGRYKDAADGKFLERMPYQDVDTAVVIGVPAIGEGVFHQLVGPFDVGNGQCPIAIAYAFQVIGGQFLFPGSYRTVDPQVKLVAQALEDLKRSGDVSQDPVGLGDVIPGVQ